MTAPLTARRRTVCDALGARRQPDLGRGNDDAGGMRGPPNIGASTTSRPSDPHQGLCRRTSEARERHRAESARTPGRYPPPCGGTDLPFRRRRGNGAAAAGFRQRGVPPSGSRNVLNPRDQPHSNGRIGRDQRDLNALRCGLPGHSTQACGLQANERRNDEEGALAPGRCGPATIAATGSRSETVGVQVISSSCCRTRSGTVSSASRNRVASASGLRKLARPPPPPPTRDGLDELARVQAAPSRSSVTATNATACHPPPSPGRRLRTPAAREAYRSCRAGYLDAAMPRQRGL